MGQSTSQTLFEEIGEREGLSNDTVEQIDRLWKKYDKVGQGLMDQKRGYPQKALSNEDGFLSKSEFLVALHSLLNQFHEVKYDMIMKFAPEMKDEAIIHDKLRVESLKKRDKPSRRRRKSRSNSSDNIDNSDNANSSIDGQIAGSDTGLTSIKSTSSENNNTSSDQPRKPSDVNQSLMISREDFLNGLLKAELSSDLESNSSTKVLPHTILPTIEIVGVNYTVSSSSLLPSEQDNNKNSSSNSNSNNNNNDSEIEKENSSLNTSNESNNVNNSNDSSNEKDNNISDFLHSDSTKILPSKVRAWMTQEIIVTESALEEANFDLSHFSLIPDLEEWKANKKYKLVLCLDGGGIRGYFIRLPYNNVTISFLECLEKALGYPLYEIFDMMAGTSTGAIQIALMAGGEGRSAELTKTIATSENSQKYIFPHPPNSILTGPKYDGKGKAKLLKEYLGDSLLSETKIPVLITTFNLTKMESWIWTTKNCSSDTKLSDVTDASSAAPTFFPPVKIDNDYYVDGGIVANDPSMCALVDAMSLWPGEEIRLISVGTGLMDDSDIKGDKAKDFGVVQWMTKGSLLNMMMDTTLAQKQVKCLLGQKFLRVNSYLNTAGCSISMDDRSPSNVEALSSLGKKWWNFYGRHTLSLIVDDQELISNTNLISKSLFTMSDDGKNPFGSSLKKVKIHQNINTGKK